MRRLIAASALLACAAWVACGPNQAPVSPSSTDLTVTQSAPLLTTGSISYTNSFARPVSGPSAASAEAPFHILHPAEFPMSQGIVAFPPRNEPNVFFGDLQALYRDVLGRPQTAVSYVDPEGQNVWLTEYFRFYLNGCPHQEAMNRTLAEIAFGGSQPVCGGETLLFPPRNLPFEFQLLLEGMYRDVLRRPQMLSYVDSEGANVWLAQYLRFRVSGCGHFDAENKVFMEIRGFGVQPDCRAGAAVAGRWRGPVRISSCEQTGTFATIGWCSGFSVGFTTSLDVNLTQNGNSVNGTAALGGIVFPVAGTVTGSQLVLTGQTVNSSFNLLLENWSTYVSGGAMSGSFGWLATYPGASGYGRNVFVLNGVAKTALANAEAGEGDFGETLGRLADSIQK